MLCLGGCASAYPPYMAIQGAHWAARPVPTVIQSNSRWTRVALQKLCSFVGWISASASTEFDRVRLAFKHNECRTRCYVLVDALALIHPT